MARRAFDVVDVTEILVHWYAAGRRTRSRPAGRGPQDDPQVHRARRWRPDLRRVARRLRRRSGRRGCGIGFPELADTRLRQTWPAIERHHEFIAAQLEARVTVATIHQRLRDEHGLAVSYASLRRYVAPHLPEEVRRAK